MSNQQVVIDHSAATELFDCVRDSAQATFEMICGGTPACVSSEDYDKTVDGITSVISLVGDVTWTVILSVPEPTAVALSAKFAGFEIPFDSSDMNDVIGELVNVLAGDIVARLDERSVKVDMSLPTVARGKEMTLHMPGGTPAVDYVFSTPEGVFQVVVAVGEPANMRRSGV